MTAPAVSLAQFEGPLDLLLALVRANRVDLTDIPIAQITRQYLAYLQQAESLDLELGSEFTYMAATLIQIKSRLLLPPDPELAAAEPDPRLALARQLLDHAQLRQAAEFLHQQMEIAGATWTKGALAEFTDPPPADEQMPADPGAINLLELLRLARKAVETARSHEMLQLDAPQATVEEMIAWLEERLAAAPAERVSADGLFAQQAGVSRWAALFLALLELCKAGRIGLDQDGLFTPIFITPIKAY